MFNRRWLRWLTLPSVCLICQLSLYVFSKYLFYYVFVLSFDSVQTSGLVSSNSIEVYEQTRTVNSSDNRHCIILHSNRSMFEGTAKFEGAPLLGEYLYLKFVNSRLLQFSVLLSFCLAEGLFLIIGLKTEFLLFAVCFLSFYTFFWAFVVVDRLLLARLIRHFEFLVSIALWRCSSSLRLSSQSITTYRIRNIPGCHPWSNLREILLLIACGAWHRHLLSGKMVETKAVRF